MGISASGHIAFGIDYEGELPEELEENRWSPPEEWPIEIHNYGDYDWGDGYYVIAIKGTHQSNYESPEKLDWSKLAKLDPIPILVAKDFLAKYGIDFDRPQWLLFSSTG